MKRTLLTLGATAMLATGALAQIDDLIKRERMPETEAAAAVAISRGLGLRLDYVVRVKKDLRPRVWDLGPVFYISERNNVDPRRVWEEHRRGASWMEIDRDRGRGGNGGYSGRGGYGNEPYGRGNWDDDNDFYRDRYDDQYRNRKGGLSDLLGDILGRRDDDNYYRDNRGRYGRDTDKQYEQQVWDQILRRASGHGVSRTWRYVDHGAHIGDIAMASHIAQIARTQPERVMDELMRTRNWKRVREKFNIGSDWESRGRYRDDDKYRDDDRYRDDGRGRRRGRDIWDDIFDIIR
ncbi:MAG: hypothetical protein ABIV13_01065 [Fimbriimonadales bacterium]